MRLGFGAVSRQLQHAVAQPAQKRAVVRHDSNGALEAAQCLDKSPCGQIEVIVVRPAQEVGGSCSMRASQARALAADSARTRFSSRRRN